MTRQLRPLLAREASLLRSLLPHQRMWLAHRLGMMYGRPKVRHAACQGAGASMDQDTPPELRDVLLGGVLIVKACL